MGPWGILQPIRDAIKLFTKENRFSFQSFKKEFWIAPIYGLILMLLIWNLYPIWIGNFHLNLRILFIFSIISLGVFFLLVSGWSGGRKYRLLGAYRSSAQSISYEVLLIFLFLAITLFLNSFSFQIKELNWIGKINWIFLSPLIIFWAVIILVETNRAPFDLSEGESELVSGFNTEYSGSLFSLIFIGEYGFMLFFSFITIFIFWNKFIMLKVILICILFIWVRRSFPRTRYDSLILAIWKIFLPVILALFSVYLSLAWKFKNSILNAFVFGTKEVYLIYFIISIIVLLLNFRFGCW